MNKNKVNNYKKGQLEYIIQYKGHIMSFSDLVIAYVSLAIGTGVTKIGAAFNNGWLTASFVSTIFAITAAYAIYLQVLSFIKTRTGTLEQCANILIPRWAYRTYMIITILPLQLCGYFYLKFCESSIISFFHKVLPNFRSIILDPIFIDLFVLVFLYIPTTISPKAKFFKYLTRLKFTLIFLILIFVTIIFVQKVTKYGFDPNKESIAVVPSIDSLTSCISTYATAYAIQPITLPSINNLENPTFNRMKWVIIDSFLIQWIANELFGIFEYYTLFSRNKGDVFFNYINTFLSDAANIALSIMMIISSSVITFPIRNALYSVILPGVTDRHVGMWSYLAVVIYVIIMFLLKAKSEIVGTILSLILDVTGPLSVLVLPAVLYICAYKMENMLHFVLSIFLLVFGIVIAIFFIFKAVVALMNTF